jgi:diadenosine tetraphosphate (Ap4A) HIT family hydrolase
LQTHFHIIPRRSGDKLWPTEVTQQVATNLYLFL